MAANHYDLRTATVEDATAVTALFVTSYPELMAAAYEASVLSAVLPKITRANPVLLASGNSFIAASADALVVGFGGWSFERPGTGVVEPGLAHIRHFAIHPKWTRLGIGRAIYLRCEEGARTVGVRAFECYSSLNGERFYASLGFESGGRIDVTVAGGVLFPVVQMRRELPGAGR